MLISALAPLVSKFSLSAYPQACGLVTGGQISLWKMATWLEGPQASEKLYHQPSNILLLLPHLIHFFLTCDEVQQQLFWLSKVSLKYLLPKWEWYLQQRNVFLKAYPIRILSGFAHTLQAPNPCLSLYDYLSFSDNWKSKIVLCFVSFGTKIE